MPVPEQPAYQNRQRPDLTKAASDNQITTPKPANHQFNPAFKPTINPQGTNHHTEANNGLPKPGHSNTPPVLGNQNNQTGGPSSSAGSTTGSKPVLPKSRPLGGFAFPGKVSMRVDHTFFTQAKPCLYSKPRNSLELTP